MFFVQKNIDLKNGVSRYCIFQRLNTKVGFVDEVHQWIIENYPDCEVLIYGKEYLLTDDDSDIDIALKLKYNCDFDIRFTV